MESNLFSIILIAATLPLVASILSAFSPRTRVEDKEDYFLFDRNLDIDGFLKITVGYSLQVASIALFFYWSFTFGLLGSLIVCIAWSCGYFLLAKKLGDGGFDEFLGTAREGTETIHGFIGERVKYASSSWKKAAILAVSLASVIGLGGTMMAEIDYSTQFFIGTLQIQDATNLLRIVIEGAVLSFTVLYVLWGGYKSAVYTDRFQVPIAYVAFSIFGFGTVVIAGQAAASNGAVYLVALMVILFFVLLVRRHKLLKSTAPNDSWDELTAYLTFVPIILGGISTIFYLWHSHVNWSLAPLGSILFPQFEILFEPHTFLGFGAWGTIALIFANAAWQFIDISSLQRLQSLDKNEFTLNKAHVVKALRVTGIEAGIGWLLIALTAGLLKTTGFTLDKFGSGGFTNESFGGLMHSIADGSLAILIPVFVFTMVVYMLSTISAFISAISYISFYDIVPSISGFQEKRGELKTELHSARVTTVVVIVAIFLMYLLLRLLMTISGNGDAIASVLYAIYAFQISIAPSVVVALL